MACLWLCIDKQNDLSEARLTQPPGCILVLEFTLAPLLFHQIVRQLPYIFSLRGREPKEIVSLSWYVRFRSRFAVRIIFQMLP